MREETLPLFTTLMGKLWAEKSKTTLFRTFSGYVSSCASMFFVNASTSPGWVGHRSITLHLIVPSGLLSASVPFPSSLVRHFHNSFSELPVVEQLYCGYCVKATALPPLPIPNPSSSSLLYISSVKGFA